MALPQGDAAIWAALIASFGALIVTAIGPPITSFFDRRRDRERRRHELVGKLRGNARALAGMTVLKNSAMLQAKQAEIERRLAGEENLDEKTRLAEAWTYWRDRAAGHVREMLDLERELEELLANVPLLFKTDIELANALDTARGPKALRLKFEVGDDAAIRKEELAAALDDARKKLHASVENQVQRPLSELADCLERRL